MNRFEMTIKPDQMQIVMGIVFCVMWFGITGFVTFMVAGSGIPPFVYLFFALFFLVGIFPLRSVIKNGSTTILTVNDTHVIHIRKPMVGAPATWQEPISNFKGITTGSRVVRSNKSSITYYTVILLHDNKKFTEELGAYRDTVSQHNRAEECCKRIGLPLLRSAADGSYSQTDAEDLDKKFSERISKKDIDGSLPAFPKSSRYFLVPLDGGFMITRKFPMSIFWTIFLYGVAVAFFVSPLWQPGLVFAIVATLALGSAIKGGQYLLLQHGRVITFHTIFGKQIKKLELDVKDVEEIIEMNDPAQGNVQALNICVQIRSDKGFISFAHGSKPEIRSWIKKAVSQYVFAKQANS